MIGSEIKHSKVRGGVFRKADMTEATLNESDLSKTNFEGAKFIGTHIIRSAVRKAIFKGADMTDADLSDSDFTGSDFSGCQNLTLAQLEKVKCLYNVKGLKPEYEKELRKNNPKIFEPLENKY